MTEFADRVITALGTAFADRAGVHLSPLVEGLTAEVAATDALVSPTAGDAWPAVFDLDTTAHPAWLGQTAGTRVPGGLTRQQQREYVRDRKVWRRGTAGAIKAAVAAALRGSRRVDLVERDTSPWQLTVQVYESEVPAGDSTPVLAAAASQKPVGIVVSVQVLSGATVAHMAELHGPTVTDYAAAFATVADARDHVPE